MTLWKRGDVYWAYVHMDGVRHAKSTGTNNRKQAEFIAQRFKDELNLKRQGMTEFQPDMTFGELAARFLVDGSPRPYHRDRLKVLLPYWGETPIGRITKARAREYRRDRHKPKQVSETTVNRDLEALRHMLFWAVDEGFLATNPLIRLPTVRERRKPRLMVTLEEERKLLEAAAPHLRSIIIAALDSGMRRGEILTQRWEHVDFTRRLLYVTHSKTAEGEAREIPLTGRLFDLLGGLRQPDGFVFTFKGAPMTRIKTAWKAAIRRAGIRYFRFHDLRHTFNTRLMEAGVMQEIRKALMGHSSGEDVNSIYTHVELPAKREAIRKLEIWIAKEAERQKGEPHQKEGENHGTGESTGGGGSDRGNPQGLPTSGTDRPTEAQRSDRVPPG
jgi:integrase